MERQLAEVYGTTATNEKPFRRICNPAEMNIRTCSPEKEGIKNAYIRWCWIINPAQQPSVTLSGMPSGKSSPTGFSSTPKPWSIEEQKDTVEEENRMRIEENKRLDASIIIFSISIYYIIFNNTYIR